MPAALAALAGLILSAPPPPDDGSALVYRLAITPAALPAEKLRYELLPPRRDRTPGNAALDYLRAAVLMPKPPHLDAEAWQQRFQRDDAWMSAPFDKLPVEAVKQELRSYKNSLAALDRAARRTRCDWQLPRPLTLGSESAESDCAPLREMMFRLRLRIKVELAEGRYDDALRSLQTGFQTARHAGEGPTASRSLIGVALTAITSSEVAECATAPGSPNLYWALAALPHPFIDPRNMLTGESELVANTFPAFREFEKGPVSEAKAVQLIDPMRKNLQMVGDITVWFEDRQNQPGDEALSVFGGLMEFVLRYRDRPTAFAVALRRLSDDLAAVARAPAARRWLRARGVKDVDRMSLLQVSYLAAWRRYRERYDDIAAAFLLPTPQSWRAARRTMVAVRADLKELRDDPVARALLFDVPALERTLMAHVRMRRQLAALQAVEAIRAHLAASGGQLPRSWAEVKVVPVPDDPLTGQPFAYTLKNGVATVAGPPPAGEKPTRANNFRYELTPRRGK
jgi:hypothetical protein